MGSLRKLDVQATYSLVLSLASVAPFLAAAFALARNYEPDLRAFVYGAHGKFLIAFLACVGLSALIAAVGFVLGWNSAGQRRNEKSSRSWIGFYVGGLTLTLNIVLLIAFWLLRLQAVTGE
jgi:divalent metal cation (Fe/Co/Zn/Cd) transporter